MIKELVIHLGDTKTGSTSIQKALANQVFRAPGRSIVYPGKNNHIGLARTLSQKRRFDEREERFARTLTALSKSDADHGIISAEHFQFVDPWVLRGAIETHWPALKDDLRLVAYVRPHVGKFLSAYAERVKLGSVNQSLDDFFDTLSANGGLDYTGRFEKWRDTFGARFELRPFVRDRLYRGDVVPDFFRYVLGSEDFEVTGAVLANSSLTISQLSLLREMHARLDEKHRPGPRFREARGAAGRIVTENMRANGLGADGDKLRMPSALVERFTERYAADAEALDAGFFDGAPMTEALEQARGNTTDTAQSLEAGAYFQPEVISSFQIFAKVLGDIIAKDPVQFKQTIASTRAAGGPDAS